MEKRRKIAFVLILVLFLFPGEILFAGLKKEDPELKKLKSELQALRENYAAKYAELLNLIQNIQKQLQAKQQEDELQKLLAEAEQLSTRAKQEEKLDISKKFYSGTRKQQGLNPNVSMEGDFFAGVSSSKSDFVSQPGLFSYGQNRFSVREVQVSLISTLDPFTRGKAFFSFTPTGVTVEEAYMIWLNLPLNLNLKAGVFHPEFGLLNRYHDHALPQFDRPRPLVNLFGNWAITGWGVAGNFLLPTLLFSHATTLDLAIINGGANVSFSSEGKYHLIYVGQFKNYYDLSRNAFLEFRISGAAGKNDPLERYSSYVGSFGINYKWVPIGRSKYRTFDWKTEFLVSYREMPGENLVTRGFYTSVQNKLDARFWISGRVDYSEVPYDKNQKEWSFTGCLDFWQSEFVFLRFQYQYNKRDRMSPYNRTLKLPNDHSFVVQVSWAMGPHMHEAY